LHRTGFFLFFPGPAAPKSSDRAMRALAPINSNSLAPRSPPPCLLLKPSNLPPQPVTSRSSFPIAAEALDSARKLPKQDTSPNLAAFPKSTHFKSTHLPLNLIGLWAEHASRSRWPAENGRFGRFCSEMNRCSKIRKIVIRGRLRYLLFAVVS
jgi:hypothetical protein